MLLASAALHLAVAAGLYAAGVFADHIVPKPQPVMTARLVRLGPVRDKNLLPTLATAARAPQVKKPSVNPAPPTQPSKAAPLAAAQTAAPAQTADTAALGSRTQSTLERLRKIAAGAPDGDAAGEADDATAGDSYTAEVERCMHAHYDILGVDDARKANREATVLVRISASGKVITYHLTQKSGLKAFDDAVDRAVSLCPQLPAPPPERREQLRRGGIEITFHP